MKTRVRYAIADVVDTSPRADVSTLRYVSKTDVRRYRKDPNDGCLGLTTDLAEAQLYTSENRAWLDKLTFFRRSGLSVVKLRVRVVEG